MEYFKRIQSENPVQIYINNPVRIEEVALFLDTVDKEILGRVTFLNQSSNNIIAIFIHIEAYNIAGEKVVLAKDKFIYQDMEIEPNEVYGNKIAINLPDDTRRIKVLLDKIVFSNGILWKAEDAIKVDSSGQLKIEVISQNANRVENFLKERHINTKYIRFYCLEGSDFWSCTCGKLHSFDEELCDFCGNSHEKLKQYLTQAELSNICDKIDAQVLAEEEAAKRIREEQKRITRLEKEKQERIRAEQERERKEQERILYENERVAKRKRKFRLGILIGVFCIGAIGGIAYYAYNNIMIPNRQYEQAIALLASKDYKSAIQAFGSLKGYKDSELQLKEASYQEAVSMMQQYEYSSAYDLLESLDYKDSEKLELEAKKGIQKNRIYYDANKAFDDGNYAIAAASFSSLSGFRDADDRLRQIYDNTNKKLLHTINLYFEQEETLNDSSSKTDYEKVLDAEGDISYLQDFPFESDELRKSFDNYLLAVNAQKNAVSSSDSVDAYRSAWEEGRLKRYISVKEMREKSHLEVDNDIYVKCVVFYLESIIGYTLDGDITFEYDQDHRSYSVSKSIRNTSLVNFADVKLNTWWNLELITDQTDEWQADGVWNIKLYIPDKIALSTEAISLQIRIDEYDIKSINP